MKKKTSLVFVFVLGTFFTSQAQKISADKVPVAVKTAFAKAYPNAKEAKWDKENSDFEASFKNQSDELSVLFDAKGKVLETEKEVTLDKLPAAVQKALKGKKVKEAAIIEKEGKTFYEAEVGGKDLLFDKSGVLVK
jgi:uncharacterized membrane protein YkoI